MSEKTYILKPSSEIYYHHAAAYRSVNSNAVVNFNVNSSNVIITGRYTQNIYNAVPSSVSAIQVKLPEYISLKDIKKIKISGSPVYDSGHIEMAWSENLYPVNEVIENNTNYGGTYLVEGKTARQIDIKPKKDGAIQFFEADFGSHSEGIELVDSSIYFYFYVSSQGEQWTLFRMPDPVIEIEMSNPISQLNAPILTTNGQIVTTNSTIQINWEAVSNIDSNKLKNYRLYYKKEEMPTITNNDGFIETTSLSCPFSLSGYNRGDKVYIGIQAVSSYTSDEIEYLQNSSSILSNIICIQINSLPTVPKFTLPDGEKKSISGNNEEHRLNFQLQSEDTEAEAEEQTITYYYKYNNNLLPINNTYIDNDITYFYLTLEDMKKIGIYSTGAYEITFLSYDGLEFSKESSEEDSEEEEKNTQEITVSFAPIIKNENYKIEESFLVDGNDEETVLKYLTIRFELEYDLISNLYPVIRIGDIETPISEKAIVVFQTNNLTKVLQIDTTLLDEVDPGAEIGDLKLSLKNGDSPESNIISFIRKDSWIRPFQPGQLKNIVITNDELEEDENKKKFPNCFNNYLYVRYDEPEVKAAQPKIEDEDIVLFYRKINFEQTVYQINNGRTIYKTYDFTEVNRKETIQLYFKITDKAGQVSITEVEGNFTRIAIPTFPEGVYKINPEIFNPNKENSFQVVFPMVSNSILTQEYICDYSYSYKIEEEPNEITGTQNESKGQIIFVAGSDYNEKLRNDYNSKNYKGNAFFIITARDPFDQQVSKEIQFTLNCQTEPYFSKKDFAIFHGYDASLLSPNIENCSKVSEQDLATQLFNAEENIIFKIPVPEDVNGNLDRIEIFISRNDDVVENSEDIIYESIPWKTIPIESIETSEGDYYYIYHKLSNHFQNKFYYFKIRALDSNSLSSDFEVFPVYIIGARVTTPIIKINNLEAAIVENSENNGNDLNIDFTFSIEDLGGSASSSGWDEDYYNTYPNLDRPEPAPQFSKKMIVEVGETPNNYTRKKEIDLQLNNFNLSYSFPNYTESKAYIKIYLRIPYAQFGDSMLYSDSLPFNHLHFDVIPTVAYRHNQIGLNTKMEQDDQKEAVLVIESYDKYNKIILKGQTEENQNEIIIDLIHGSMIGVTLDGGSWDD